MEERFKKFYPLFRRLVIGAILLPPLVALPNTGKREAKSKAKSFVDYRRPHIQPPAF
jgi:hypothetical protein